MATVIPTAGQGTTSRSPCASWPRRAMPSCSGGRSDGRRARDTLAGRSGKGYDPAVVTVLVSEGEHWLAEGDDDLCARVLDAEPAPVVTIAPNELDTALGAIRRSSST